MASNQIRRSGAHPNVKADSKKSGFTVDPGPYEAIVQGYVTGSRMGQLIVTIPDWSGIVSTSDQGYKSDQIVVSYASPFFGSTYGSDSGLNENTPYTAGQSYGFWFVPPDIGNKVLVTFVAGDMHRGYWFACVYDTPSHHMVPANGRSIGGSAYNATPPATDPTTNKTNTNSVLPVVEADINDPNIFTDNGLTTTKRFPHTIQTLILVGQGLDGDKVRGAISSSSMRESPSNVYGISTPGRRATANPASNDQAVFFRKGGHTFVMDDGADGSGDDPVGTDQLVRLRTAGGHQLLMNDTEHILYIASDSGRQWMEFSNNGSINIFAANGYNIRSAGAINMHSDSAINMCAPTIGISALPSAKGLGLPKISISSSGSIALDATTSATFKADTGLTLSSIATIDISTVGDLSMSSQATAKLQAGGLLEMSGGVVELDGNMLYLNCSNSNVTDMPKPPKSASLPKPHSLQDTLFNGSNYINDGAKLFSTVTVAPAHEPWVSTVVPPSSKGKGVTRPTLTLGQSIL